jgi:hypothetical protein
MIEKNYKRDVAYKISISQLISGTFVKSDGLESDYISLGDSKISRVNMIGTVVDKNKTERIISFVFDDGDANITATFFDNIDYLDSNFKIGDVVLLIGRVNDFNGIKINGEILRKIDKKWADVRKKEVEGVFVKYNNNSFNNSFVNETKKNELKDYSDEVNEFDLSNNNVQKSPYQRIWEVIKEKDGGNGVDFEMIKDNIKDFEDEKIENICQNLLKEGEIYEIRPGFYKILE